MAPETPITLESVGLSTWSELYALDSAEIVRLMDEKKVPLHPGDAFLAVAVLRGVFDLREATLALDRSTHRLLSLTVLLAVVALATLVVVLVKG